MPQISKIRIVNFRYNDGNRLIADELYDFENEDQKPSDVLINLVNGGGKSVLVQLMMQPIIPKARVAGRKIESFFTKASDHCYVVLEWALDNSKMKLMTGIAMSARDESGNPDSERGFQIKYYTFISSYQDHRDRYNIADLPLARKENGRFIPASFDEIRNLAKKSNGGLVRYASDDNIKWRDRLAQYGIVQDEWHMIEELNSNEDGMSKYFSVLKSSNAVIDKLILPCIEGRQDHGAAKDDSSLETMLLSYAKQFSKQQEVLRERKVFEDFHAGLEITGAQAEALWERNAAFEKSIETLFAYSDALGAEISRNRILTENIEREKSRLKQDIQHIRWEKASAKYYTCKAALDQEEARLQAAKLAKEDAEHKAEKAEKYIRLLQCAHYYEHLQDIENKLAAINQAISDREHHSEDGARLASLKYSAFLAIQAELERITPELAQLAAEKAQQEAAVETLDTELACVRKNLEHARSEADKADAVLDRQRGETEKLVGELGIHAFRMLDGNYQEDALQAWKKDTQNKERSVSERIRDNSERLQTMEQRRDAIPQEKAEANSSLQEITKNIDALEGAVDQFHRAENEVKAVMTKHSLDPASRFTSLARTYLEGQIAEKEAAVADEDRRIEATAEEIAAVESGTLHIPRLLLKYLDGTGLRYTTCEKYLLTQMKNGLLSEEDCKQLLMRDPYAAYGVIVREADKVLLAQEAEGKWLPAVLPVFTNSEMEQLLSKTNASPGFSVIAAYAQDYFSDSTGFAASLQTALQSLDAQKARLEEHVRSLRYDQLAADAFAAYDAGWENRTLAEIEQQKKNAEAVQERIAQLEAEHKALQAQINLAKEEHEELCEQRRDIRSKLSGFEKLLGMLQEEKDLFIKWEQAEGERQKLQADEKRSAAHMEKLKTDLGQSREKWKEKTALQDSLKEGLGSVADAPEAELVTGAWKTLLQQYQTLLEKQSTDLKNLNQEKDTLSKASAEKQEEIQKRGCDQAEFEDLVYSKDAEAAAEQDLRSAEKHCREANAAYMNVLHAQGKAESSFERAAESLAEFGGKALPTGEVGKDFDARISEQESRVADLAAQSKAVDEALRKLQRAFDNAETAAADYSPPDKVGTLKLEADYAAQLKSIAKQLRDGERSVSENKHKVEDSLRNMEEKLDSTASVDVGRAIRSMHELLSSGTVQGDRYYTLYEHIHQIMYTVQLRISQIDTDLKEFHKTKDDLIHQCMIQGKQMYEGLAQLSSRSKVKVQNKRRQMLKFSIPDAVDENIARVNIHAEIEHGTMEIVAKMADDAYAESDLRKIAHRTVGSTRLLRRYINAENIELKAYKIDRNPDHSGYRTWEQTQVNNSGAEKFVVYFAVILALMAYTRDSYDDTEGKHQSVLILDNPFGPISSRHVLEPMFEIARNYHVQMICLSDISKSDIVSCFELVIRAVVKRFALSSGEQLVHEGNERIEHGFYRSEQIDLF